MARYILKRILLMIPVVLGISLLVFSMLELSPGDPAQTDGKTVAAHDWKNNAKLAVWKFSLYILCDGVDTGVIALCPGNHSLSNAHHITVV